MINLKSYYLWSIEPLKQFSNFNGRTARTEFWIFTINFLLIQSLLTMLDSKFGISFANNTTPYILSKLFSGPLELIFTSILFIPGLAISVRRFHDVGYSGWWLIAPFVVFPFVFIIAFSFVYDNSISYLCSLIVFIIATIWIDWKLFFRAGQATTNFYGDANTPVIANITSIKLSNKYIIAIILICIFIGGIFLIKYSLPKFTYDLAEQHFESGDFKTAIKWYSISLEKGNKDPGVYYSRGASYAKLKDNKNANLDYNKAIQSYTAQIDKQDLAILHYKRAVVYEAIGNIKNAEIDLYRALELDNKLCEAALKLGEIAFNNEQPSKALIYYNMAIAIDPKNAEAYTQRSYIFTILREYDASNADAAFVNSLDYKDRYKARLFDKTYDYEKRIDSFKRMLDKHRD